MEKDKQAIQGQHLQITSNTQEISQKFPQQETQDKLHKEISPNVVEWTEYQTFMNVYQHVCYLFGVVDRNWNTDEYQQYVRYLNDVKSYIEQFVFVNGLIAMKYEAFQDQMNKYGVERNPLGYKLYLKQSEYLNVVSMGKSWKEYMKEKKAESKGPTVIPKKIVEPKKEVTPKQVYEDPKISTKELTQQWPQNYKKPQDFGKPSCNVVFVGHVDSGKSTLLGTLAIGLKQISTLEIEKARNDAEKNNMASWGKAYLFDDDENARARGKTIECSKMCLSLPNKIITVLDAPGHRNYVPSMIIGACQVDVGILIISARTDEFEAGFLRNGQTKQHAILLRALGIRKVLVVVSKMDTVDWRQERFQYIKDQVSPFLKEQCAMQHFQFIPIDSLSDHNVFDQYQEAQWYEGKSLVSTLNEIQIEEKNSDAPLRLQIVDSYKEISQTYVFGRILQGKISQEGQILTVLPQKKHIKIKRLMNIREERIPYALAGENVMIKIKYLDDFEMKRGDILSENCDVPPTSSEFITEFYFLKLNNYKKIISSGYRCVMHLGSGVHEVEVSKVESQSKKGFMMGGERGRIHVRTEEVISFQKFESIPSLGMFTLRDENSTIGFGKILKYKSVKPAMQSK